LNPESKFAIDWWKNRHAAPQGYFPNMEQHKNWRLYPEMAPWFVAIAEPRPEDTALEIGAGYRQWMAPMSRLVRRVDGFDIHPSLVTKFNELLGSVSNVRMRLGDGTSIPVEFFVGEYSLIYSISVFQHMPRAIVHGYIKEATQILAKDGRCVFHFRHADNNGPYSKDIAVDHKGDWSVGWTEQEAVDACAAAGLKVVKVDAGGNSLIVKAVHA